MQRKVKFYPRRVAEALTIPHHIISIGEKGYAAKLHEKHHVLRLEFNDIESEIEGCELFSFSHAVQLIGWLQALPENHNRVIVHCEAGISRSAAVAQFMIKDMGYELEKDQFCKDDFSLANGRVYGMLRSVMYEIRKRNELR